MRERIRLHRLAVLSRVNEGSASVTLMPRPEFSACLTRCARNSSTTVADRATSLARPDSGSLYRTPAFSARRLCTTRLAQPLNRRAASATLGISPRRNPQSTASTQAQKRVPHRFNHRSTVSAIVICICFGATFRRLHSAADGFRRHHFPLHSLGQRCFNTRWICRTVRVERPPLPSRRPLASAVA